MTKSRSISDSDIGWLIDQILHSEYQSINEKNDLEKNDLKRLIQRQALWIPQLSSLPHRCTPCVLICFMACLQEDDIQNRIHEFGRIP